MPPKNVTPAEIEAYLALLEETPKRIEAGIQGVSEAGLTGTSQSGNWSAIEILAHLQACAEVWSQSIYLMRLHDTPTIPSVHPRDWAKLLQYQTRPFLEIFQMFSVQRQLLLGSLNKLPFEDWSRGAIIAGRNHTIFSQVRRMARHEREHCEQFGALFEHAYKSERYNK